MNALLPSPIAEYFRASNAHDTNAVVAVFHEDAVVGDEGKERRGSQAIREWSDEVNEKYRPQAEVTDIVESGAQIEVTAMVSGTFPGSPIAIQYRFALRDGKVAALRIEA